VTRPLIELGGICRTFGGEVPTPVLRDVSLTLNKGEMVAIVGRSGSGKSTLLNLIGLLDSPSSGTYRFDGHDVSELSARQLAGVRAHGIGFVFQSFHLLDTRTVLENVELGLTYQRSRSRNRRSRASVAVERVGLSHRASAFPPTLSGGERQRVAVARAVVANPRLLLCDEPTGNLDTQNAEIVIELLTELNRSGLTVVIVTHDHEVASRCQRTISVVDGAIQYAGTQTVWTPTLLASALTQPVS
jgi:putative ABC transport system ATP-binding protein